jgi:FKBP-type peptidyl-prolyl cis-trans isomerase
MRNTIFGITSIILWGVLALACVPCANAAVNRRVNVQFPGYFNDLKPSAKERLGCIAGSMGWHAPGEKPKKYVSLQLYVIAADAADQKNPDFALATWGSGLMIHRAEIMDGEEMRDPFLMCLRPGKYLLRTYQIYEDRFNHYPELPVDSPFEIVAGKTSYIGSFAIYEAGEADQCGGDANELRVVATDRSAVDLPFIQPHAAMASQVVAVSPLDYSGHAPILVNCISAVPPENMRDAGLRQRQHSQAMAVFDKAAAGNKAKSDGYLAWNKVRPGMQTLDDGVQYLVIEPGSGATPTESSTVVLEVAGPFPWGEVPKPVPAPQRMDGVSVGKIELAGIREVLMRMPAGSTWEVTLPPEKAYGSKPGSPFPPSVAVVFRIKLESVQ